MATIGEISDGIHIYYNTGIYQLNTRYARSTSAYICEIITIITCNVVNHFRVVHRHDARREFREAAGQGVAGVSPAFTVP